MGCFDRIWNDDKCEITEGSEERENILKSLAKELTLDDIGYMYCERMRLEDIHSVISREYDSNINEGKDEKLIYFRMKAEYGYYLDDDDDFYLDGEDKNE